MVSAPSPAIVPPAGGHLPHVHGREEEGVFILEGEITFTVNGERAVAQAGMFANMPVGTPHSFSKRSLCAKCRKRSPKPVKTSAPWHCPRCLKEKDGSNP